jgi:putative ABC transport system permease protein
MAALNRKLVRDVAHLRGQVVAITSNHFLSNEIAELQVTGIFIPAIFLTVTAFLIHLVLSRLVTTQRDQIAVLKAFGYRNSAIGFHYLKLAFLVIVSGVALGIGVGSRFGYKITALYQLQRHHC